MSGRNGGTKQGSSIPYVGWIKHCMDTPIQVGSGGHIVTLRCKNLDLCRCPSGSVFTSTPSL
eukprot:11850412-Alexandrium_andersonii.AAC.1